MLYTLTLKKGMSGDRGINLIFNGDNIKCNIYVITDEKIHYKV